MPDVTKDRQMSGRYGVLGQVKVMGEFKSQSVRQYFPIGAVDRTHVSEQVWLKPDIESKELQIHGEAYSIIWAISTSIAKQRARRWAEITVSTYSLPECPYFRLPKGATLRA